MGRTADWWIGAIVGALVAAYEVAPSSPDVEIFSRFVEREILQSRWPLGERVIAKKAAAVSVAHGDGRVVLTGSARNTATRPTPFNLVFNALFTAPQRTPSSSPSAERG